MTTTPSTEAGKRMLENWWERRTHPPTATRQQAYADFILAIEKQARAAGRAEALAEVERAVVEERDALPTSRLDPGELLHIREDTGALLTEVQRGSLRGQNAAFGWLLNRLLPDLREPKS